MHPSKLEIYKIKQASIVKLSEDIKTSLAVPPRFIHLSFGGQLQPDISMEVSIDTRFSTNYFSLAVCDYIAAAIHNRSDLILADALELAKADTEVARKEAIEEAKMVLEQTK